MSQRRHRVELRSHTFPGQCHNTNMKHLASKILVQGCISVSGLLLYFIIILILFLIIFFCKSNDLVVDGIIIFMVI